MVTKLNKTKSTPPQSADLSSAIKDSAQQIWQAGLGAFMRAQAEGSKAYESLVKEGVGIQRKTQAAAEEKISETGTKMSSMASDFSAKASGQWDKLESIFEDRVAKALGKLGVPSAKEVNELTARIDELTGAVKKLSEKSTPTSQSKPSAKTAARKAPTKRAAAAKIR